MTHEYPRDHTSQINCRDGLQRSRYLSVYATERYVVLRPPPGESVLLCPEQAQRLAVELHRYATATATSDHYRRTNASVQA